jgi:hypothetical protein
LIADKLLSGNLKALFVQDVLDVAENISTACRGFGVRLKLRFHYDIGYFTYFSRKRILRILNLLDTGATVFGDRYKFRTQFARRIMGRVVACLYALVLLSDLTGMPLTFLEGIATSLSGYPLLARQRHATLSQFVLYITKPVRDVSKMR